jgi:hypothetical protein
MGALLDAHSAATLTEASPPRVPFGDFDNETISMIAEHVNAALFTHQLTGTRPLCVTRAIFDSDYPAITCLPISRASATGKTLY